LPLDAVIWCQTTATLAGLAAWQFGGGLMQWYNVVNWEFKKKKYKEANDKKNYCVEHVSDIVSQFYYA